jgi:hypothetical protein
MVLNPELNELHASYAYDVYDLRAVVGYHSNVFVGEVVEEIETFYVGDSNTPYTKYKVLPLLNIKGEVTEPVYIIKECGLTKDRTLINYLSGDTIPETEKIYVFAANLLVDGTYGASGANTTTEIGTTDNSNLVSDEIVKQFYKAFNEERKVKNPYNN